MFLLYTIKYSYLVNLSTITSILLYTYSIIQSFNFSNLIIKSYRARKNTRKPSTAIQHWLDQHWRGAWESKVQRQNQAGGTQAVAQSTPWEVNTQGLRKGLTKAENTMATLLRTGIIGLKDQLYWVGVPVSSPRCKCGWLRQTLKYIILLCPLRTNREVMLLVVGTENYNILLLI